MPKAAVVIAETVQNAVRATGEDFIQHLVHTRDRTSLSHNLTDPEVRSASVIARITPKTAQKINEFQTKNQREAIRAHTKVLASAMSEGQYLRGNALVIALVTPKEKPNYKDLLSSTAYLIDGQHRVKAIIDAGKTVPMSVMFIVVRDEEELRREASGIDRGRKRTHRDLADIAEIGPRYNMNIAEAKAYAQAVYGLIRDQLDTGMPFRPADIKNPVRMLEAYEHYAEGGKAIFNVVNYGVMEPSPNAKRLKGHIDRKAIYHLTVLAPLLAATMQNPDAVEAFLAPIMRGDHSRMKTSQNIFLDILRNGFFITNKEYLTVMGEPMRREGKQSGSKTQKRVTAAVLFCFRSHRTYKTINRQHIAKDVITTVDMAILKKEPIEWRF